MLVNEAFLSGLKQVLDREGSAFESRRKFFAYAARVMRSIRANYARERLITEMLDERFDLVEASAESQILLDNLLDGLREVKSRAVEALELRMAGYSIAEIAELTNWSLGTIKADIAFVKGQLVKHLRRSPFPAESPDSPDPI